jgi:hypothetical protein
MEQEYKMEIEYMTKKELSDKVAELMKKAKLKDKKWIYNYFSGHDDWPIITDEVKPTVKPQLELGGDYESSIHLR